LSGGPFLDNFSNSGPILSRELLQCIFNTTPFNFLVETRLPFEILEQVIIVHWEKVVFADVIFVLLDDELEMYSENWVRCWRMGVGLGIWWECGKVGVGSFITCCIELGFVREFCMLQCCILMTFHMMQFDGEWYPAYHLNDFVVEVIIVADCQG